MKRLLMAMGVIVSIVLCVGTVSSATAPAVTIEVLNPPPDGLLELAVGESYTFDIEITSDEPFVLAMAMTDQYYPGRSIYAYGGDRVTRSTLAMLHLTVTGKRSTADLVGICDWPDPGICWPDGVAPAAIVAGVRYKGGQIVPEQFPFAIVVP